MHLCFLKILEKKKRFCNFFEYSIVISALYIELGIRFWLPWLIWATYSSFAKISVNKMENRSKNTWPCKILCGHVFCILFCIVFCDYSGNRKDAAARNFTRRRVILRGRLTYLIKSKLIVLKLIIDTKLKLLQGISCI